MPTTQDTIRIGLELVITRDLKNISKKIETAIAPISGKLSKLGAAFNAGFQPARAGLVGLGKTLVMTDNFMHNLGSATGTVVRGFDGIRSGIKKITPAMNRFFKRFAGWALSIMFFGMALKRVFTTIWKKSTEVFQEVAHSIEGVVTPLDTLNGLFKYLMFTVGDALMSFLEPYIPTLVEIVDKWTDWINQNKILTSKIIFLVGVIGSILMVFGMVWLGLKPIFAGIFYLISSGMIVPLLFVVSLLPDITTLFSNETTKWGEKFKAVSTIIVGVVATIAAALAGLPFVAAVGVGLLAVIVFKVFERLGFKLGLFFSTLPTRIAISFNNVKIGVIKGLLAIISVVESLFSKFSENHPKIAAFLGLDKTSLDSVSDYWDKKVKNIEFKTKKLTEKLAMINLSNKKALEDEGGIFGFKSMLKKWFNPPDITTSTVDKANNIIVNTEQSTTKEPPTFKDYTLGEDYNTQKQNIINIDKLIVNGSSDDDVLAEIYRVAGVTPQP